MEFDWESLTERAEVWVPTLMGYGSRAFGALLMLFVAWLIAAWISRILRRGMQRAKVDETLTRFAAKAVRWVILLLAVLTCLSVFGVQTTSFAAVIGAAGLAIGLAFQGTLSNLSAGVMLLVFRPFKVGDVVIAGGETGKVDAIDLFSTTLDTPDNRRIIVPNGSVFGGTIENVTHHDTRRVDVAVGVDYSADIDETRNVLDVAAASVPGRIDDPGHQIVLSELGASSVDWVVRIWCATGDYWDVREAALRAVKQALDNASIGIPYPQMDVHLDQAAQQ